MLSLGLSVLVLLAIGMAIDVHYRMLDVRRTNVEESQLARAALRHIANDLMSAVQYVPPDLTGLDAVAGNTAAAASSLAAGVAGATGGGAGGIGGNQQAGGQNQNEPGGQSGQNTQGAGGALGAGGAQGASGLGAGNQGMGGAAGGILGSGSGGTAMGSSLETGSASATSGSTTVVGIYGTASELQFDVSRLPRLDQYEAIADPDSPLGAVDIPSDIKTVVYFVASEESLARGVPEPSTGGIGRGLMRSELDRAVSSWSTTMNGGEESLYAGARLLAKEVTSLAFQYFDGTEWLTEWDSSAMGGLPVAVEIVLTIAPTNPMTEAEIAEVGLADGEAPQEQTYRLVVHLPMAVSAAIRDLQAQAEEAAMAANTTSEFSGTNSAATPGGTGGGEQNGGGQGGAGGQGSGGLGGGGFGSGGGRGNDSGGFGSGGRDGDGGGRGGEGAGRGGNGSGRGSDGGGRGGFQGPGRDMQGGGAGGRGGFQGGGGPGGGGGRPGGGRGR